MTTVHSQGSQVYNSQNMSGVLDVKMDRNDAGAKTIRDYLRNLLTTLWKEDEGFSGKRPFGNSDWKYEVYAALIKAKYVPGRIGKYGDVEELNKADADKLILEAIRRLQ